MDLHDVGHGPRRARGHAAPGAMSGAVDRYPLRPPLSEVPARRNRRSGQSPGGVATYVEVDSPHGHDGFLINIDRMLQQHDHAVLGQGGEPMSTGDSRAWGNTTRAVATRRRWRSPPGGPTTVRRCAPVVWASSTFTTSTLDEARRRATMASRRVFSLAVLEPVGEGVRGDGIGALEEDRGCARVLVGHGIGGGDGAGVVLVGRSHRRPAAALLGYPNVPLQAVSTGSASTSRSSTVRSRGAFARCGDPGQDDDGVRRDAR